MSDHGWTVNLTCPKCAHTADVDVTCDPHPDCVPASELATLRAQLAEALVRAENAEGCKSWAYAHVEGLTRERDEALAEIRKRDLELMVVGKAGLNVMDERDAARAEATKLREALEGAETTMEHAVDANDCPAEHHNNMVLAIERIRAALATPPAHPSISEVMAQHVREICPPPAPETRTVEDVQEAFESVVEYVGCLAIAHDEPHRDHAYKQAQAWLGNLGAALGLKHD